MKNLFLMGVHFCSRWAGDNLRMVDRWWLSPKSNHFDECDVPRFCFPHAFCLFCKEYVLNIHEYTVYWKFTCSLYSYLCCSYMSFCESWTSLCFFRLLSQNISCQRAWINPLSMLSHLNPWNTPLEVGSDSPRKCVPLQTWSPRRFPAPWAG